jgi:hypothetical protein
MHSCFERDVKTFVIKDDLMISRTSLKRLDILGMIVKAFGMFKTLGNFVQVVALFGYSIVAGGYDHSIFVLISNFALNICTCFVCSL